MVKNLEKFPEEEWKVTMQDCYDTCKKFTRSEPCNGMGFTRFGLNVTIASSNP